MEVFIALLNLMCIEIEFCGQRTCLEIQCDVQRGHLLNTRGEESYFYFIFEKATINHQILTRKDQEFSSNLGTI